MRKNVYEGCGTGLRKRQPSAVSTSPADPLPNRLLTAMEVAEFIGCHEETVRRAYLRGLLKSQRFGVRGRRFHAADVLDWIKRGRTHAGVVKEPPCGIHEPGPSERDRDDGRARSQSRRTRRQ